MQITMLYVEALLKFSMTFQSAKQTNTSYYEIFKILRDTVKDHVGKPGYHERLYKKYWERLMLKHGAENETTMEVLVQNEYKNQAMVSSCKEFYS